MQRYDTVIHMLVFFVFGVLVYRALQRNPDTPEFSYKRVMTMLGIVLGYGVFDEFHQAFTPGREVDLGDFLADLVGGLTAGAGIVLLHRRRLRPDGHAGR